MAKRERASEGDLSKVAGMRASLITQKRLHSRCFLMKFVKFTEHHFLLLQKTAWGLLLISRNILNVSLALSAINQFSYSQLSGA